MLGDAALANRMAAAMLERGVYVVGFSYPVVPKGKARIRVQLSAGREGWVGGGSMGCWPGKKHEAGCCCSPCSQQQQHRRLLHVYSLLPSVDCCCLAQWQGVLLNMVDWSWRFELVSAADLCVCSS
jgi:hypothetical protein